MIPDITPSSSPITVDPGTAIYGFERDHRIAYDVVLNAVKEMPTVVMRLSGPEGLEFFDKLHKARWRLAAYQDVFREIDLSHIAPNEMRAELRAFYEEVSAILVSGRMGVRDPFPAQIYWDTLSDIYHRLSFLLMDMDQNSPQVAE